MFNSQRILVLAPHTDDGELGCGASIAKYAALGKQIIYAAFSTCSQSLPAHFPKDTLADECREATELLGVQQLILCDFEVRHFQKQRQEILEELVSLNKEYQPQTVLLPARNDVHQDHQAIYAEGIRAFKNCNLLGYELSWNNLQFTPTYFEKIEEQHLKKKQEALHQYKSQSHRKYMRDEFIRSLAIVRGVQADAPLAEAFEIYRLLS